MIATPVRRLILAFTISPGASAVTIVTLLSLIGRAFPYPGFVVTVTLLAYGSAIVLGIPVFLLTRAWQMHSAIFYAVAALAVGTPLIVIAAMLTGAAELSLVAGIGAVVGGLVFCKLIEGGAGESLSRS